VLAAACCYDSFALVTILFIAIHRLDTFLPFLPDVAVKHFSLHCLAQRSAPCCLRSVLPMPRVPRDVLPFCRSTLLPWAALFFLYYLRVSFPRILLRLCLLRALLLISFCACSCCHHCSACTSLLVLACRLPSRTVLPALTPRCYSVCLVLEPRLYSSIKHYLHLRFPCRVLLCMVRRTCTGL